MVQFETFLNLYHPVYQESAHILAKAHLPVHVIADRKFSLKILKSYKNHNTEISVTNLFLLVIIKNIHSVMRHLEYVVPVLLVVVDDAFGHLVIAQIELGEQFLGH